MIGIQLPYDPSTTQKEACRKWADNITEEILFGGNKGGGKSNLGAACIFHDALTYPDTRYFIAREELNDLRLHTKPTIAEIFQIWGIDSDKYAPYNGQDNQYRCYNKSVVQFLQCKFLPSDPLYERFGSMQWTKGWMEEGGEIAEPAYTNLKLGIGRWNNDKYNIKRKLLITANPKKNWMKYKFVDPAKKGLLPPELAYIPSSVYDNKHRQQGYEKVLEGLTGTARQRLLLGDWDYDSDDDCLISSEKIFELYVNQNVQRTGIKYISSDVGRFGKDKTTIWVWDGMVVIQVVVLYKKDTTEVAREILRLAMIHQVPMTNIVVDDDGIGGGVVDKIPGCYGFVNNSGPLPNKKDPNKDENFENLKAQCYYELAEQTNKAFIKIEYDLGSMIDPVTGDTVKQMLNQELEQVRKKAVDKDRKNGILAKDEVKKILGRSPDYSDGMMMRMVFELSLRYSWVGF